MTVQIFNGDAIDVLRTLEDNSINCIITSPPYFGLRSYLRKDHPNKDKELGLEPTLEGWLANQMCVFAECHRVLKKRGVMWVNIGDSYYSPRYNGSAGKNSTINGQGTQEAFRLGQAAKRGQQHAHIHELGGNRRPQVGLKAKDRMGVPHRLVFALQAAGWWWRDEVIWAKTNTMPESTKDRTTKAHEFMFMLTKSAKYDFDAGAYREPAEQEEVALGLVPRRSNPPVGVAPGQPRSRPQGPRKPVSGWNMGEGSHETSAHARARDGQKQSTKFGRDKGWRRETVAIPHATAERLTRNKRSWWALPTQPSKGRHYATFPTWLIEPALLASCPFDGVVLDPYGGTGTVGLVAERHHRNSILIDLNEESCEDAYNRIRDAAPLITQIEVLQCLPTESATSRTATRRSIPSAR